MILDGNLIFDATYSAASGLAGVNVFTNGGSQASTNVLDMLQGRDMGQSPQGPAPLQILVLVTTAFAGGASLNIQLQGSTDNVTYTTYAESGAILTAALVVGTQWFRVELPSTQPDSGPPPRYYRLNYQCVGAMAAGAVISILGARDGMRYYKPGIVVSN